MEKTNKKPLEERSQKTIDCNTIIAKNDVAVNTIIGDLPKMINDVYKIASYRYINIPQSCILNVVIAKFAQMICAKRVKSKEVDREKYPNWFALLFMPSGAGKDVLVDDLNKQIFKFLNDWYKRKFDFYKLREEKKINKEAFELYPTEKEKKQRLSYIKTECKNIRNINMEVSNGTQEGLYSDAEALQLAQYGCIFLKISEFGAYLETLTPSNKAFINCLYEAYEGKFSGKSIKGENSKANIEDIPANCLLYSDPTIFKTELKKSFEQFMLTGLSRRLIITFKKEDKLLTDTLTAEEIKFFANECKKINDNIEILFNSIKENAIYCFTDEAIDDVLQPYEKTCKELYNNNEENLIKREILSRPLKAIKLACIFAVLNHPQELIIKPEDAKQAIKVVEFLSKDYAEFLNYKPEQLDKYDKLFNYFLNNLGKKVNKSDFITTISKEIEVTRRCVQGENLKEMIETVKQIADKKGYVLLEEQGLKNATYFYMMKKNNNANDDKIIAFENAIKNK